MAFTIHDGEARPARGSAAVKDPAGLWETKVQVRWPGDLSQRMYRRPVETPSFARRHSGFLIAAGIALATLIGSFGGSEAPTEGAAHAATTIAPTGVSTGRPALEQLPEFSDAYWERHSIQPQALVKKRGVRNEFKDAHRGS